MPKRKIETKPEEKIEAQLMRLPIALDWCYFKDEIVVAQINWDATKKAGKPMMDLSVCMTRALNQNIYDTVQWDKNKFKPCDLTDSWNNEKIKSDDKWKDV